MGNTQSEETIDPEDPSLGPDYLSGTTTRSVSPSPSQSANPADQRLNAIKAQNYDIIRDECCHEDREWVDPLFPADSRSVYLDGSYRFEIEWLRPQEICERNGVDLPRFFTNGPSRFDLDQGELGDCWLLAAIAALADRPELLARVIPDHEFLTENSGFERDSGYGGVFRFCFYHFGEWVEVCVDDLLPTYENRLLMVHSASPEEFWGALLEKAYAKLFGSYEALKGGVCSDSLMDMTGGICETFPLKRGAPRNFGSHLNQAVERGALICTGIWGDANSNMLLPNGLVLGHAYTVSAVDTLYLANGGHVDLVRIRNPWGDATEWKGKWGDQSAAWHYVPDSVKLALQQRRHDDGEFWMEVQDFVKTFDDCDICYLTPDSVEEAEKPGWHLTTFFGQWTGASAGGRMKYSETFANNPQFVLTLTDVDEDQSATVLVELSQMDRRGGLGENLNIGFVVYQLGPNDMPPLSFDKFQTKQRASSVDFYSNLRTISKRMLLTPGRYVVVPTTWEPGEQGRFVLRIWSEAEQDDPQLHYREINAEGVSYTTESTEYSVRNAIRKGSYGSIDFPSVTQIVPPIPPQRLSKLNPPKTNVFKMDPFMMEEAAKYFRQVSPNTLSLDPYQLKEGLNRLYPTEPAFFFDLDCCKALINAHDPLRIHKFHWKQFLPLYRSLNLWARVFTDYDKNKDGFLMTGQCFAALTALGFESILKLLSEAIEGGPTEARNTFQFHFADHAGLISFSNFVLAVLKVQKAKESLNRYREKRRNRVKISKSELVSVVLQP
uniref:Calpain catalytic domain-containing protein n=1 Tax=Plectus sambesii TaxID=2011161 RepID=A0A914UVY6_9BILA